MRKLILFVLTLIIFAAFWLLVTEPVKAGGYSYSYPSYSYYTPTYYNYQTVYQYKEIPVYKDVVRIKEVTVPTYAVVPLYSTYYTPSTAPQASTAPCNGHAASVPQANTSTAAIPSHAPNTQCAEATARVAKLEAQLELLLRMVGNSNSPPPEAAVTPKGRSPVPPPPPKAPAPIPKEKLPPPPKEKEPEVKEPTSAEIMQGGVNSLYTNCASCHEKDKAATHGGNFTLFDKVNLVNLSERKWARVEQELDEDKMPPKKDKDGNPVPAIAKSEVSKIKAFLSERKKLVAARGD